MTIDEFKAIELNRLRDERDRLRVIAKDLYHACRVAIVAHPDQIEWTQHASKQIIAAIRQYEHEKISQCESGSGPN